MTYLISSSSGTKFDCLRGDRRYRDPHKGTINEKAHQRHRLHASVKAIQNAKGSRASYAKVEQSGGWNTEITQGLETYLADLDMFYLGTATADCQPYIQYRGGKPGFLKVVDDRTLAFADFRGNRQYISTGNLSENPKAFIFLMDYANSRRIKVWGTAKVVENYPELLERLTDEDYLGKVERAIVFTVEAWDINCPQHIHKRMLESDVAPVIEGLEAQVQTLKEKLRKYEESEQEIQEVMAIR